MKFTVEREHLLKPLQQVSGPLGGRPTLPLLKPLQQVSGPLGGRPTLPILGNLLLQVADGTLSLTGTDLEMEMVARWWHVLRWFSHTSQERRPFRRANSLISAVVCLKARKLPCSWKVNGCWYAPGVAVFRCLPCQRTLRA